MARFETFERDLLFATAGISHEAISGELARFAKAELARAISSGEGSALYDRFVNSREGLPEEAVEAPGPILYVFNWWGPVIIAALAELQKRSPRRSGRFASSFIVISGGQIAADFNAIPSAAEVIITNFQPYIRKVEGGLLGVKRRRVFDGTKNAMARRFGNSYRFETRFLNIGGGVHPMIPYVLKRGSRRKDRQAGMPISYPSIVINAL